MTALTASILSKGSSPAGRPLTSRSSSLVGKSISFRIAAGGVTSAMIATDTIAAGDIATGAVGATEIAAGAVSGGASGAIVDNSITADDIGAGAVGASELATGAVVGGAGGDIADGTITGNDIAENAIDSFQQAPDSVRTEHIVDGQIYTADIANNTINATKILDEPEVEYGSQAIIYTPPYVVSNVNIDPGAADYIQVTLPAAGYVIVTYSTGYVYTHTNGTDTYFKVSISKHRRQLTHV